MRFLDAALAILVAFLLHTVLGKYFIFFSGFVDLFSVIAAGFGLLRGRMVGLVTGTCAGLVQDAFSGGLLGLNGIAKTTVGYLAGIAGRHLIIRGWSTRLLFFALATLVDLLILFLVGQAVELPMVTFAGLKPLYLCVANAIAGVILLRLLDRPSGTRI